MGDSSAPAKDAHLCVLIHGLWGNPKHLANLAAGLRAKHAESELRIFISKSNSDSRTYDGIEVGGERVAQELEDEVERLAEEGVKVTKLSVVGYSLGGLIARYCVGLLHARGLLDRLEPVNFNAFASPFLGVRSPSPDYRGRLWNVLGAHALSTSGQQLFVVDKFRDTGRPLLSLLADPDSVFMQGLARFRNRALYANVQNDRSAPFWTTGVTAKDPYEDMSAVDMHFVPGYEPVVADPDHPVSPKHDRDDSLYARLKRGGAAAVGSLPFYAFSIFLLPFGLTFFMLSAPFQTFRSNRRVRLHNEGKLGGRGFGVYRIPLLAGEALETLNAHAPQRHLTSHEEATRKGAPAEALAADDGDSVEKKKDPLADFRVLALTPEQFQMIENLDQLGFRKYPVLINVGHSHAAIVVRFKRPGFKAGHTVIKHWVEEEFEI